MREFPYLVRKHYSSLPKRSRRRVGVVVIFYSTILTECLSAHPFFNAQLKLCAPHLIFTFRELNFVIHYAENAISTNMRAYRENDLICTRELRTIMAILCVSRLISKN